MAKKISIPGKEKKHRAIWFVLCIGLGVVIGAGLMRIGVGQAHWAGMHFSNLTPQLAVQFNVPQHEHGIVIEQVDNPAMSSGVHEGDLIKGINNENIESVKDFLSKVEGIQIEEGVLLDVIRNGKPLYITVVDKVKLHQKIHKHLSEQLSKNFHNSGMQAMTPVAMTTPAATMNPNSFSNPIPELRMPNGMTMAEAQAVEATLPSPKEQGASKKILSEGHWLGMELIPLIPQLAQMYNVPAGTSGVLVDEIALVAAESGILAGDVVLAVEGVATPDLLAFTEATRSVKDRKQAGVLASRRGQLLTFTMASDRSLGFSQSEAASPIMPGAISPHRARSQPCTACHLIMATGGQLATDAGDILPNPPPIRKGTLNPHIPDRGKCNMCHVLLN